MKTMSPFVNEQGEQVSIFDNWKEECLKEKEYYLDWGTPMLNTALMGAKGGMSVLISGAPNHGKSIFLTTTIGNLIRNNKDVVIIDFTLDDPCNKRITQYIAANSKLDMNTVDFINTVTDTVKLDRFDMACKIFRSWIENNKLYMYESSSSVDSNVNQASIKFIVQKTEEIRAKHPNSKIVVSIDSLNDIEVGIKNDDPYVKSESVAKELNRLITRTDSLLLASTHLRKSGGRRPTLEDLKGNNYLAYSAKVAIGIYNDIKLNKDKAKVYWLAKKLDGSTVQFPIVEAHFLKSKVSSFNSVISFMQWPAQARLEEPEDQDQYISMIYGAV